MGTAKGQRRGLFEFQAHPTLIMVEKVTHHGLGGRQSPSILKQAVSEGSLPNPMEKQVSP